MALDFDPRVTVEGAATALAVLGAAIGYIVSLIRGWRYDYLDRHYRGTKLLILDLLERQPWTGLTEEEIWQLYGDPSIEPKRKEYGAWKRSKLGRIGLERELKQAQLDFLIDLAGPNRYRLRLNPVTASGLDRIFEAEAMKGFADAFPIEKIIDVLKRIAGNGASAFRRASAIELLVALGSPEAREYLAQALSSEDEDVAIEAARTLARYLIAISKSEAIPALQRTPGLAPGRR